MPNFGKGPTDPLSGWDMLRGMVEPKLQIVPLQKTTKLELQFGQGLELKMIDAGGSPSDPDSACVEVIAGDLNIIPCSITITGRTPGARRLQGFTKDGRPFTEVLTVQVVADQFARVFDGKTAVVGAELTLELALLKGTSLQDAVVEVAEDQLNSGTWRDSSGRNNGGKEIWWRCVETYHGKRESNSNEPDNEWCGWFVAWCYTQACKFKGLSNPFGSTDDHLASGIKAVSWAMCHTADFDILNYFNANGATPHNHNGAWGTGAKIELASPTSDNLQPGDVCLVRDHEDLYWSHKGWTHVCQVHDINWKTGTFSTLDGNAGGVVGDGTTGNKIGGMISINRDKSLRETIAFKSQGQAATSTRMAYKYVFLHAKHQ